MIGTCINGKADTNIIRYRRIDDNKVMEEKELQEVIEAIFENVNCEALNINLIKINRSWKKFDKSGFLFYN